MTLDGVGRQSAAPPASARPSTGPVRAARAGRGLIGSTWRQHRREVLTSIGLVCMAIVFFQSVAGILPDGTLFWLITPVRAVLLVGLLAMALVAPRPAAWRTWLDIPVAVLLVTSLAASFGRADSMAGWRWLLTEVGLYYLVVIVRRQHRDSHRAALVFGLVGVATAAFVALQQAAAQTPTGFCRAPGAGMADGCEQPGALVRVIGTMSNPNLLAAFLLLLLPLAWLAVDEWLNSSARLAGFVIIGLGGIALVQTWSRAGLAAGVIGMVALFTLVAPRGRRLRLGGAVLGVALFVAVLVAVASGAGVRTKLWAAAASLAVHHPLGVGLGRSGPLLTRAIPGSLEFQHAHNTWLNWFVEAGWLGGLAVTVITVLACWRVWRSAVEGSRLAAALGAGLVGFGLMSLTDHPANALRIALALAFVLGLVMSSPIADQRILTRPGRKESTGHTDRPVDPLTTDRAADIPETPRTADGRVPAGMSTDRPPDTTTIPGTATIPGTSALPETAGRPEAPFVPAPVSWARPTGRPVVSARPSAESVSRARRGIGTDPRPGEEQRFEEV